MRGMEVISWTGAHWLDLLQSVGIISGFAFTAHTIRKDSEARKIGHLIAMGQHRHAIWKQLHEHPGLSRLMDKRADVDAHPLTNEEQVFVTSLVVHLHSVHQAVKAKMFVKLEGMQKDIKSFFSLPIPKAVWEQVKPFQDEDFVEFVENSLAE